MDPTDMRLEFVVAFNDSDSTAGWFQFFLGTTLYLSSTVEETLDPMYSLNLRFFIFYYTVVMTQMEVVFDSINP